MYIVMYLGGSALLGLSSEGGIDCLRLEAFRRQGAGLRV